jgi:putative transposase
MFYFLTALLNSIFKIIFSKKRDLIFTLMVLKKENQIFKRQISRQKIQSTLKRRDRLLFSLISKLSRRAVNHMTIVKPSTLLDWQRRFFKNYWSYKHKTPGRKPVSKEIKNLILEMKIDNQLWGCHRIADELKKLGIDLNPTTVNRIIQTYRKQGKIQPNGSWRKFLKTHWCSLFGMDIMTIDTLLGTRFYLLIILELKSRKIIRYDLTENPCREFVKQRIELFSEKYEGQKKTLIYDNAAQFTSIDYSWYDIKGINICTSAPNMNAFIERLNGSIRREALDHFLLFSEKQIRKIVKEYVDYYNYLRPHQTIGGIPEGNIPQTSGIIRREKILGGLHHNYFRSSA